MNAIFLKKSMSLLAHRTFFLHFNKNRFLKCSAMRYHTCRCNNYLEEFSGILITLNDKCILFVDAIHHKTPETPYHFAQTSLKHIQTQNYCSSMKMGLGFQFKFLNRTIFYLVARQRRPIFHLTEGSG